MDQAISLGAADGCAALIEFVPKLSLSGVLLPPQFVISFPPPLHPHQLLSLMFLGAGLCL